MERQKVSKSIDGTSDLVVWAPIRQGFVDAFENITFETRLSLTARAFDKMRATTREYERVVPFVDTVQRILILLNFRIGPIDQNLLSIDSRKSQQSDVTPRRYMYLAATFDGPLEPYMRLIWKPLGPFLDLLLCNCEDYVAAGDNSFDDYMNWVRHHQIDSAIFYSAGGLTVTDQLYLAKLERQQRDGYGDLQITKMTSGDPEKTAQHVRKANPEESAHLALEAVNILFALANYYPPSSSDGRYLLRAAQDLLEGWDPHKLHGDEEQVRVFEQVYKEPLAWFRSPRPQSEMPTPNDRELDKRDVQKGLLSGHDRPYAPMTHGALLLLQLVEPVDPGRVHNFLRLLEPNWEDSEGSPPAGLAVHYRDVSFDFALTFQGLERLHLSRELLNFFPKEFRDGMTERAPMIGDVQDNHPRRWPLPARYFSDYGDTHSLPPVELTEVDIAVQLRTRKVPNEDANGFVAFSKHAHSTDKFRDIAERRQDIVASLDGFFQKAAMGDQTSELDLAPLDLPPPDIDPNPLATLIGLIASLGPAYGVQLVAVENMVRGHAQVDPETNVGSDPSAPPTIEHFGFRDGLSQPVFLPNENAAERDRLPLGDLLCGYRNSRGDHPADPRSDFLRNSSFMVVRKMRQYVEAFELLYAEPPLDPKDLAARLVGRKLDGTPLIKPVMGNDFDYSNDLKGEQCPFAAHIRLSNPRQEVQQRPAPRILRRGMSYGQRYSKKDPDGPRGIVFIAYNASIAEQYEVIQRWLNRGNSTSVASAQNDPLTGTAIEGYPKVFRCSIDDKVHRITLKKPLAAVEWGAYFFVPSRTAWKRILEPSRRVLYSVEEGEKILDRLATLSSAAQRREWKVLLEDFLAKDPSEKNQSPQLWAAIRHRGGVHRVDSGIAFGDNISTKSSVAGDQQKVVLVADPDLILWVLSHDGIYSVREQGRRVRNSFGDIYVAQDPHDANTNYSRESRETNQIIWDYSKAQQDGDDAYESAYDCAKGVLDKGKEFAAKQKFFEIELSREFLMPALGQLCTHWFDIPDIQPDHPNGEFIELGGWGWAPVNDGTKLESDKTFRKPRCPGDFLAPSRYAFYPRPTQRIQMYGQSHGKALRAASLKIVKRMVANEGAKLCGKISARMFAKIGHDPDLLARNLIGSHGRYVAADRRHPTGHPL